jgi:hypothetical protein
VNIFDTIMSSPLTPITLSLAAISLIITSFARGWIVSRFTVETLLSVQNLRIAEAIKRGDDYKLAWELSEKRADILQKLVDKTTAVGENVDKILSALPLPPNGGSTPRPPQ